MKNETFEQYIDRMNAKTMAELAFIRPISPNVDYVKLWSEEPSGKIGNSGSYSMYFIKNPDEYVAVVLDMGSEDLHFFVKEEHRGNGYLCKAMNSSILHHLFSDSRECQSLTFQDSAVKDYCLRRMPFKDSESEPGKLSASMTEDDLQAPSSLEDSPLGMTQSEFELVKARISKARYLLMMANEQIEQACGSINAIQPYIQELLSLDEKVLREIERKFGRLRA